MIDRCRKRRLDGQSNGNNGGRLRPASLALSRSRKLDAGKRLSLALVCTCFVSIRMFSDVYTASAFSIFRPDSIQFRLPSSLAVPKPCPTSLFLFSLRNDNNGEGSAKNNDDETIEDQTRTATIDRTPGWDAEKESADFSAWMEGLRKGTPLGKLASSSPTILVSKAGDSGPSKKPTAAAKPPERKVVGGMGLGNSNNKTEDSSDNNNKMEDTGRRKINPLSNLIQFEAMLELAKIAGNKKDDVVAGATGSSNDSSATDVFAVVDRLVKTFQKQEEEQQKGRNELLELAQLEETIETKDEKRKDNKTDGASAKADGVSATTTVKDLMELERYVGGLDFRNVGTIWDSFGGKGQADAKTDDTNSKDDSKNEQSDKSTISSLESSSGVASSSSLFRAKKRDDAELSSSSTNLAQAAESILKETTDRMEYLVAEASSVMEPSVDADSNVIDGSASALQDLMGRASSVFNNTAILPIANTSSTGTIVESISNDIVAAAQKLAKEAGVDINVQFAADRAREATEFAVGMTATANMVLDAGYAYGSRSGAAGMTGRDDDLNYLAASAATQTAGSVFSISGDESAAAGTATKEPPHQPPLFGDFPSAQRIEPHEYDNVLFQGAEMGGLAGAIYEDTEVRCHKMGHSFVANGTTANVAWMVTDSVMDRETYASRFRHHDDAIIESEDGLEDMSSGPVMIRTITLRGFDASDESVDREALLNDICLATAEPLDDATANKIVFHKGLLNIARQIYAETKKYIDWASPQHKIILNGHSVGGSLSVLMLLLITSERGVDYVRDRIPRVYSHGSPPVAALVDTDVSKSASSNDKFSGTQRCPILETFDLPASMIYGFIQPYDPVVRLFSNHDVLYPLVDDLGKDGITLYATGPIRSLRPITRAIFQAWDGWPQFRDNWKGTCDMEYQSVGIQHMLLPEPLRYLNDRFISVNVGVPPVDAIVRISPEDLLPALDLTFPLDTFQVSLVPQAVRSFLHHFFPGYDAAISDYAKKIKYNEKLAAAKKNNAIKPFQTKQS